MPAIPIEILGILFVIILLITFFTVILPKFIDTITTQLIGSSAEVIAKHTSGLITLIGAASYDARLNHLFSENVKYTVEVEGRTLKIIPHFEVKYAEKSYAIVSVGIEISKSKIEKVRGIKILKSVKDFKSSYKVVEYE